MIDYKGIADADTGGSLDAELAVLQAETVDVLRDVESRMISARGVYGIIGEASGKAAVDAIKALITDAEIKKWFAPSEGGVDSLLIGPAFDALATGGVITQNEADLVKSYAYTKEPKYPGVSMRHLIKARRLRSEGII